MVTMQILGCSYCGGGDTNGSKNKTRLVAAGPPGWAAACEAIVPMQSAAALWTARPGVHGHAFLETAHGNDLLLQAELEGEGMGSPVEDGVGAVVERVKRGDNAAVSDPDEAVTVPGVSGEGVGGKRQ
jgi:hypothetical protein